MKPVNDLEKFFKNAAIHTNPEMDDAVFEKVLTAREQVIKTEPAQYAPDMWRIVMRSRITKLAAVVAIIVSIVAAMSYLGLPVRVTSPVFADMIEQISKAHSVTYQQTIYTEGRELPATRHMVNEFGVMRWEGPQGCVSIYDRKSGKSLLLNPAAENAQITYRVGRDRGKGLINYLSWLSNLHQESARFRGREKIDGKTANVFVVEQDFRASIRKRTIWVDPETDLPVRVELVDMPDPSEGVIVPKMSLDLRDFGGEESNIRTISISGDGVQSKRTIVWSDFLWNPDLDGSLFSLEPPEGYSVEEITFDVSDKGENGLVDALAFWTQMSGGLFPSQIADLGDPNKVRPMLIEKYDRDGDPKEEFEQAMEQMNALLQGLWFAQKCKVQGSWHYNGANLRLGDADTPICWWKPEDSDGCRVIYGDLSIGDSPAPPHLSQNH
jgi:outer membrane lipoprotein-sorting protein